MKRKRIFAFFAALALSFGLMSGIASATIHPIVESFDCANEAAFAHHPLGDVADPIGQTPGVGAHSDQSSLRAVQSASANAFSEHKLNGECGKVGQ
ncbi:hypothetical protein DI005_00805 [Prauserella sp. PE36]|uniref:Uncharacterized protein n=1 Tax=Prauserella endophytica TaxID=1592324 RepID=A0ABY2S7J5_9PSEU|nr:MULTISPECIES: hypothetical protein [Prauserella]PXY25991.1 hypothetical protein BAY59_20795 [Prauserella coralliicola]RBM24109.1 hypothetical protein DI005_00805 [Prauserella sp. PE36]TKG71875.1 hypothetical protein FCN18_10315 [Prauserella endophytica]